MHTPAARMHHSPIHRQPHGRPHAHHTRAGTSPSYEVEVRATDTLDTGPDTGMFRMVESGAGGAGSWCQVYMTFRAAALKLLGGVHIKTLSEDSLIITKTQPSPWM